MHGSASNVEIKAMDSFGNPYLAVAAIIAAGLQGIEDNDVLPQELNFEGDPEVSLRRHWFGAA